MDKKYDAVKFQRERQIKFSEKLTKMTPKEMIKFFKSSSPKTSPYKQVPTTSA